jgi:hypothetical protein
VLIYTDHLKISYDEVVTAFGEFGHLVRVVEEANMYQSVFVSYGGTDEPVARKINDHLNRVLGQHR